MNTTMIIFKREFMSFFATPVAYVFILVFLLMSGLFTFILGNFFERGQSDLLPFFSFHPWLYLFVVPAIAMRSWSEERKSGNIELLMTLPISTGQIMAGKFFAAWAILGVCLLLTFPLWLTVDYLGSPDHGIIAAAYASSWLMSGAFLAISMCMSALNKNQVIAFIMASTVCFLLLLAGTPAVLDVFESWVSNYVLDSIASISFLSHFQAMSKGIISLNDVVYFILSIMFWLSAGYLAIESKKAK